MSDDESGGFPFSPEKLSALAALSSEINAAGAPPPLSRPVVIDDEGRIWLPAAVMANGSASSAQVAARLGKSPTSGWWRQGLRDLKRSNVVTDRDGQLQLHPFFQGET